MTWRRTIECVGLAVGIEIDGEPPAALVALLSTFAPAPSDEAPALRYRAIAAPPARLERDGAPLATLEAWDDLTPVLELDLYRSAARAARGWLLHAGAVVGAGGAVVFAGASGAGKSTLMRALLGAGRARYLSEEAVLLSGATARGLCRPLNLAAREVAAARAALPAAAFTPYPLRGVDDDGTPGLLAPPPAALWHGPATARALVRLRHGEDAPVGLAPLTDGAALAALWPLTLNQGPAALDAAMAALAAVPTYDLHTRAPTQALATIAALLDGEAP